jgi:hypothetical protein
MTPRVDRTNRANYCFQIWEITRTYAWPGKGMPPLTDQHSDWWGCQFELSYQHPEGGGTFFVVAREILHGAACNYVSDRGRSTLEARIGIDMSRSMFASS